MREVVIWGTGLIGYMAYMYYKDRCKIKYFVDSDEKKQSEKFFEYDIYSPDILNKCKCFIIVAVKNGREEVEVKLRETYKIKEYTLFSVNEELVQTNSGKYIGYDIKNTIIICFSGGLGNQMFQYAFYKAQCINSQKVIGDISSYKCVTNMPFSIENVFPKIKIYFNSGSINEKKLNEIAEKRGIKFLIYNEDSVYQVNKKEADLSLLNVSSGFFRGIFQTYKYASLVEKELRREFIFDIEKREELLKISRKIVKEGYISVHIRRGDYLLESNAQYLGGICTQEYYERAIYYMKKQKENCRFCFLSDDIQWVKQNFNVENSIYIESNNFSQYEDWYDMYLMSICKHNIIANSTFSWWGAWLNQNPEKIVIAPKKWVNGCDYKDIYPPEWICL